VSQPFPIATFVRMKDCAKSADRFRPDLQSFVLQIGSHAGIVQKYERDLVHVYFTVDRRPQRALKVTMALPIEDVEAVREPYAFINTQLGAPAPKPPADDLQKLMLEFVDGVDLVTNRDVQSCTIEFGGETVYLYRAIERLRALLREEVASGPRTAVEGDPT
jgi:hypothetical protein